MNQSNNGPKPGTPEYDAAMVAKFRGQPAPKSEGDGERMGIDVAVPHGADDPYGSTAGRMGLSVRTGSTLGPEFGRGRIDPGQLVDMRREMDRIRGELADVVEHDRRTGEPIYRHQGNNRTARERRLNMLTAQYPLLEEAINRQREADAEGPPRPGTFEALLAEKQKQDELRARAEGIADEREAQALADKIMQERRRSRG